MVSNEVQVPSKPTSHKRIIFSLWEHGYHAFNEIINQEAPALEWNHDEEAIAKKLLSIAVELYQHEKSCNFWSKNTDGGKRDLLFFIERARMVKPFYPQHRIDLADFENLLYAVMAKLRELEEDLSLRCKNGFLNINAILHHRGKDCDSDSPFSVMDFWHFLVAKWRELVNEPVVDVLNLAVFMRNIWDAFFSKEYNGGHDNRLLVPGYVPGKTSAKEWAVLRYRFEWEFHYPPHWHPEIRGLSDQSQKSVAMIMGELHEKYAPQLLREKRSHWRDTKEREFVDRRTEAARYMALKDLVGKGETPGDAYEDVLNVLATKPTLTCDCDSNCICAEFCKGGPQVDCVCKPPVAVSSMSDSAEFLQKIAEMEHQLAKMKGQLQEQTIGNERKEAAGVGKAALKHAMQRKARAAAAAPPKK
ncbi:MAG: hypothetical protein M1835_000028 [Candelina submexicana]|nr:MAG: hypothetical protein M1835_000028 [Candelina submexicana]